MSRFRKRKAKRRILRFAMSGGRGASPVGGTPLEEKSRLLVREAEEKS